MASFLAMPAPLRVLVLRETIARLEHSRHVHSISSSLLSAPISFVPSPSNMPPPTAIPQSTPPESSLAAATAIMTTPRPKFLYSAPHFRDIPMNTHVPEVCLLGRSNVGKSTLLNALTGVSSSVAGKRSAIPATREGLAITSAKAGCTKTMNAFGFGPPAPLPPELESAAAEKSRKQGGAGRSRKEVREDRKRRWETAPPHSLVVMDMPGYGLHSKLEWGAEIAKYLAKRKVLRGAVLLIDAVAGVKDGDRMVLGLLRDANIRTTVVLTKVDKLGYGLPDAARSDEKLREQCLSIWDELRYIEKTSLSWSEEKGWDREIWVTGAGDPKSGDFGIAGARLAICRMAGLIEEETKVVLPKVSKIVPFDQIQWAPSSAPSATITEGSQQRREMQHASF